MSQRTTLKSSTKTSSKSSTTIISTVDSDVYDNLCAHLYVLGTCGDSQGLSML